MQTPEDVQGGVILLGRGGRRGGWWWGGGWWVVVVVGLKVGVARCVQIEGWGSS